jgi:hypothetical protein
MAAPAASWEAATMKGAGLSRWCLDQAWPALKRFN